ncbi:ectopic P granules protein 5 homolog isoform X2 [Condylostylus longicornis]|uniref:ectopic P granules protein 5 homolog isoform X2 n=1 Tax=Condylostylus longicornis TaxID=2530218 RepID=UPI00244E134D|nr:ectopic P granules protein 5 homolog isoform X2 [Condylostylus longicornis]
MATIEKTRVKKKKKVKETSEPVVEVSRTDSNYAVNKNANQPEEGRSSDLTTELFVDNGLKNANEELINSENPVQIDRQISNVEIPTAPIIDQFPNNKQLDSTTSFQYPDLKDIEICNEPKLEPPLITKISIAPNPMTRTQLSQLYECKILDLVKQFELEFLASSLKENFDNDPLYTLLQQYAVARSKIKVNLIDLKDLKNRFEALKNDIWKITTCFNQDSGVCNDNVRVTAKESYEIREIDQTKLENLYSTLTSMHELICFSFTKNKITAETAKLKVDQIIREILSHPCFIKVESYSDIRVVMETDSLTLQGLSHLRRALSILFSCLRKPPPDKIFSNDLIVWIDTLVSAYLRVATIQDHWFLIFQILRCPSGVSKWATKFIQIPEVKKYEKYDLMECLEMNHCLSILQILLLPIKKRSEFLFALSKSHREISDPVQDDVWIIVDSDGEEGSDYKGECLGMKENDLISFLNQIPLEMIFRCAINAEKNNSDYDIESDRISEYQFLRIIAFFTNLIEVFGEGLLTYNIERYKQFAKRLGRLIRHTIHYVSDIHEIFLRNKLSKDPFSCDQITVEMNAFIIKSCSYIYKTPNLATWQYFASLPFTLLQTDTLWQLFLYLNVGFPDDFPVANEDFKKTLCEQNFWFRFNLIASHLSPEDLYYLIQAFFEMANDRDRSKDWEFIETVCSHIFLVGFVNEPTRETCYKTSRDMLTNLTLSYPELIDSLLLQMKIRFGETDNLIYLVKSLPLENWKANISSFEILSNWLLNYNYDCKENALARIIISHLNWCFDTDKRLFLPHNIHVRMACLICEALNKHNPEIIGASSISEGMRQVSNLIENHSDKEQFTTWCWNMISLLRLHLMDQNSEAIKRTLQNPSDYLCFVPDLENFDIIHQGVTESRPLALYISLLISLWGHSIPLICQKGINQMKMLLLDHRYKQVIRCIQLITPLFLESPDTLSQCESFHEILKIILNADRTYIKMAKDLVKPNSHGPVFEHFINMMQSQIIHYYETGLTTPSLFIHLWLDILSNFPNWQNTNVVFLVDAILKIAYQFSDSWSNCKEFFREYYKNCNDWKMERASTFKLFLSSGNQKKFPNLSTDCGWLSLLLLELEHETQECNILWPEFLRNLFESNEKNLDIILKRSCNAIGYQPFPASSLVLYKYANLIANSDVNHPLLPIFGQKFFLLYLARINLNSEEVRFHSFYAVSDKFYEFNIPLMKKMKLRMKSAEENYAKLSSENAGNEVLLYFYTQCAKIMKTFLLWLEETDLQKISKQQRIDLPPQYNTEKLMDIINGNEQHWTEFIYLRKIRDQQKQASSQWLRFCFRLQEVKPISNDILQTKKQINAIERIKNHLKSYEKPLEPPCYQKIPLLFNPLAIKSIDSRILEELRRELKYVDEFTENFNFKFKEMESLNTNFKEQIQLLYKNVPYLKEVYRDCSSITRFNKTCIGPAAITLKLKRPQKIESVQRKVDDNREKYEKYIQEISQSNINALVYSIQNMEHIVRCLLIAQAEITEKTQSGNVQVSRVAIDFFYDILKSYNQTNTQTVEPCNESFSCIVRELGIFIQNNQITEGPRILDMSLKRPDLLPLLSELLIPLKASPEVFLKMYRLLIDAYLNNYDGETLFILLSKFNVNDRLKSSNSEMTLLPQLLKLIFNGLENWNKPESGSIQDLFRQHLVCIFNNDFPRNCLEVLQIILNKIAEQKICTVVLLDLLNSLFKKVGCNSLTLESSKTNIEDECIKFANRQNFFDFKTINDIFKLFSQHFQNERFNNGLHGLYPKYKNYCLSLSMWFTLIDRSIISSAISIYPGILGNQICDSIFAPIIDLYSPWLTIYKQDDLQHLDSVWSKNFSGNGKDLLPWDASYLDVSEIMIHSFVNTLQYILKYLPVSNAILGHVYSWYQHHFVDGDLSKDEIRLIIQKKLMQLNWEKFSPETTHIDFFYRTLNKGSPTCKAFLCHIFGRIEWSIWMKENYSFWDLKRQSYTINLLLPIFVKISFEPTLNSNSQAKILYESLEYPWETLDVKNIEEVLNWLTLSSDSLLNKDSGNNAINEAILKLLEKICGMTSDSDNSVKYKRVLYIRTMVKILYSCSSKNNKLLKNVEALKYHHNALVAILNNLDELLLNERSLKDQEIEGQNLLFEIIGPLQNTNQTLSKPLVDAITYWQSVSNPKSIALPLILNSFGLCKTFNYNMYLLLEETLYTYFKSHNTDTKTQSWADIFKRLSHVINNFDYQILLQGQFFLVLHLFILYKIQNMNNPAEKITFLQDLSQILGNLKINEINESRLILLWGAVITCGCKMLVLTENAKKPLLMMARQLFIFAKQCEGWSDSLLGAIGLRRDSGLYKRKILFRCLSSIVFSLFPDQSGAETKESQEFVLSLDELINESLNKSTNYKQQISQAIEIITNCKNSEPENVTESVFILINLFYNENFMQSAQHVWKI